jgi:CheY-like chemotaxis protein
MAKIIVVDDDVESARITAAVLLSKGHEVELLHSTDKAVETLTRARPDLLILDVMFPDSPVAGFDLAREIRRHPEINKLPILLLTGVNQEFPMGFCDSDIDSNWMPIQSFIEKPFKIDELLRVVANLLEVAAK